jgi:5-methylcytosine-specific restriction endonuclease McrA
VTNSELHAECDGICYLCETPIDLTASGAAAPSIDHVQATYVGGRNVLTNIRLTHQRCNVVKSGRLVCPHCQRPA